MNKRHKQVLTLVVSVIPAIRITRIRRCSGCGIRWICDICRQPRWPTRLQRRGRLGAYIKFGARWIRCKYLHKKESLQFFIGEKYWLSGYAYMWKGTQIQKSVCLEFSIIDTAKPSFTRRNEHAIGATMDTFCILFYVHFMQCQAFLISKYRTRGSEIVLISEPRYFRRTARPAFAVTFPPWHTEARRVVGNCA